MRKAMGLSCLISKPNTHEGRRDQLTCPGKDDSKCLAGKRRYILRTVLYCNRPIYGELFTLHSSKDTRGHTHSSHLLKLSAAIKTCHAFSIHGMPSCIHLMFFIPKEQDSFKNMSEELLMSFYTWRERNKANTCTSKRQTALCVQVKYHERIAQRQPQLEIVGKLWLRCNLST